VLGYVQAILTASERLDEAAISLSGETEARLTFVLSDTLHPDVLAGVTHSHPQRCCTAGELPALCDLTFQEEVHLLCHTN